VLKGAGLASRCFPSQAYLIETRAGLVLFDTGYAERFGAATSRGVYRLYPAITPVAFEPEQALVRQLAARGIAAHDIRTVVLSHFHADHMAGLRDFPRAAIVASAAGWDAVRGKTGLAALAQAFLPQLLPGSFEQRLLPAEACRRVALPAILAPFTTAFDVLGTGEVLAVPLPGHAPGHLGAFVHTEAGWTLLAADAAWASEAYTELRGPSELTFLFQHSRRAYYATLGRLATLHRGGGARIALTHVQDQGERL
jgi:glyoxylase-like metal-dependent hydrolase (beta-lactamase superfamily II)